MIGPTTPPAGTWLAYRCAPAIAWLRDAGQILLIDVDTGQSWRIRGVEAAIWDFLTLAYPYARIVRFVSLLLRTPIDEAERTLLATLHGWQSAGIVQTIRKDDCGEPGD